MRVLAPAGTAPCTTFDPAKHLGGHLPDLPTPFDAAGGLDLDAFTRLCRRLVDAGAQALVVCTATGEAPTLTHAEREALIRCAVATASSRTAVIAGVTSCSTAAACMLARDAERAGASAILVGVPYYNKPMQAGIEAHVRAIAQACDLPIILHDEPHRSVRGYADDTIARLAGWPAIVGLCDASGEPARATRLRKLVPRAFRLLSGDDVSARAFIAMGGDGCISAMEVLVSALLASAHTRECREPELAALADALARESDPAPLKFALSRVGLLADDLRLPLVRPSQLTQHTVTRAMAALPEAVAPSHPQGLRR